MRIVQTGQSTLPPPDKPIVKDPVRVYMDIPLYYATERGPVPWDHSIFCARIFADTVLVVMNDILLPRDLGMVHLGFYNPRLARKKDGTSIEPHRWSNHAYGEAGDWKGVVTAEGVFHSVDLIHEVFAMDRSLLQEIWYQCAEEIKSAGRQPEMVNEGDWIHIGIWPEG